MMQQHVHFWRLPNWIEGELASFEESLQHQLSSYTMPRLLSELFVLPSLHGFMGFKVAFQVNESWPYIRAVAHIYKKEKDEDRKGSL
jgi:hypothetical protein